MIERIILESLCRIKQIDPAAVREAYAQGPDFFLVGAFGTVRVEASALPAELLAPAKPKKKSSR